MPKLEEGRFFTGSTAYPTLVMATRGPPMHAYSIGRMVTKFGM